MGGIATLAGASVNDTARPIKLPMTPIIGVIPLTHWIFDVVPATITPAGAGVQQHISSATGNHLATNHTPMAFSALSVKHAGRGGLELSAETPQPITTALNGGIATHWSGRKSISYAAHTLTRGCY